MADYEDVCALVPTLNEAETIGTVVAGLQEQGISNVLVVDGHSTDGTREIARETGARVIEQSGRGKGQAVREGLRRIESPYILMLDGDGTYRPADAPSMLEPLLSGRADHVIGNRFDDVQSGAMSRLNLAGNRLVNRAFGTIHGRNLGDILSGYRAFSAESVRPFALTADGFGIETQLAVECVKHGVTTEVVPITYQARPADSETNLHPLRDGAVIFLTLYSLAKTNNPLFYFGSVGVASVLTGVAIGAYVAYEWIVAGVSHEVLAVVGTLGILLGVQLVIFGVLSDMIVTLNREQTRRLEEVAGRHVSTPPEQDRSHGEYGEQAPVGTPVEEPRPGSERESPPGGSAESRPDGG